MKGKLTVITGCMFSGKTTKLIALAENALDENKKIVVYYPDIDTRYKKNYIVSHDKKEIPSTPLPLTINTIDTKDREIIFIDEVQFFSSHMIEVITNMVERGVDVVVSGLDRDYRAQPFGIVPDVIEMANEVIRLEAKCTICGSPATFTYRVNAKKTDETIVVGGIDLYEARCEEHYIKPE